MHNVTLLYIYSAKYQLPGSFESIFELAFRHIIYFDFNAYDKISSSFT